MTPGPPPGAPRVVPVGDLPDRASATRDLPVPRRALAVGAHPDDIEFGAGATLARWAADGCEVTLVVLTDGSKGSWDAGRDRAALVSAREAEQRVAAAALGAAHLELLRRVDGELDNTEAVRREVCRAIRRRTPDVVLGHDPWRRYRLHPDHRHAGFVLTDAVVAARDPLFFADQGLAPHRPSTLLLFEADEPNHVEDAAGHADVKLRALLAHESQHRSTMGISAEDPVSTAAFRARVETQLAEHGRLAGVEAGEAFHRIDEI